MNRKKIVFWASLAALVVVMVVCFFTCKEALVLFAIVLVANFVGTIIGKKLIGKSSETDSENKEEENE